MNVTKIPKTITPAKLRVVFQKAEIERALLDICMSDDRIARASSHGFILTDRDAVFLFEE